MNNHLVEWVDAEPWGLSTDQICERIGKTPQDLGDTFQDLKESGDLMGFAGLWMTPRRFDESFHHLVKVLEVRHGAAPYQFWQPRDECLAEANVPLQGKPLDRWLTALGERRIIRSTPEILALFAFRLQLTPKQDALLQRVEAELIPHGVQPATTIEIARALAIPVPAAKEILSLGAQAGRLVDVPPGFYYLPSILDRCEQVVLELAGKMPGGFAASDFRDAIDTSRKFAVPILEHFDAIGFTKRIEDLRIVNPR